MNVECLITNFQSDGIVKYVVKNILVGRGLIVKKLHYVLYVQIAGEIIMQYTPSIGQFLLSPEVLAFSKSCAI